MPKFNPPIFHPVTGELVPFGRRHRVLRDDFLEGGTIPTWLATTGTYFWEQQSSAGGFARVTSAATPGAVAMLRTARGFSSLQVRAMGVTLQAIRANSNGPADIGIQLVNSTKTAGVVFHHALGEASAEFLVYNGATVTPIAVPYQWNGAIGRAGTARNLTLIYSKQDHLVMVMSDDSVIAVANVDGLIADINNLQPGVFIQTDAGGSAVWVQVESFEYEQWA